MPVAYLDDIAKAYARDGFVNAGLAVEPHEVDALVADLEPYTECMEQQISPQGLFPGYAGDISKVSGQSHFQVTTLWKVSEPFRKLVHNERILEISARLSGSDVLQLWADIVQYKPARTGAAFQWHQDAPYHRALIEPADSVLAAWIALDDVDENNGCMWMVPGSHRWGDQEPHLWAHQGLQAPNGFGALQPPERGTNGDTWRGAVPCRVRAGEVHFHHALTWHGSPWNHSEKVRRAYTINYIPRGVRAIRTDARMQIGPGGAIIDAGPEFPVVYRGNG